MIWHDTILWLLPILVILWWIPQNVQHEAAHALAAKHWGAEITRFWPFPSWDHGQFQNFAHVRYSFFTSVDETARGCIAIAPQALNTLVLCLLFTVRGVFDLTPVGNTIVAALAVTNFVDGAVNLATFYRLQPKAETDGWKFQRLWGFKAWKMRVATVLWHLWFGLFVLIPWGMLR